MTAPRWVPAVRGAEDALVHLREHEPTQRAFTLRTSFRAPGAAS